MTPEAERFNGWAAMLGFVAAVGAYVTTGQIIPAFSNERKEARAAKVIAETLNGRLVNAWLLQQQHLIYSQDICSLAFFNA